jgi:putative heme-binding domain-containing protein
MGFVSADTGDAVEICDITGQVKQIKTADIKERKEMEISMMPEGLANALSLQEFASLVSYLTGMKE